MKQQRLYGIIAGGLAFGAGAYFGNSILNRLAENRQREEAQEFFSSFPFAENLPGAARVEKYEVAGARHCLVDVRQSHYGEFPSLVNLNSSTEKLESIVADLRQYDGLADAIHETQIAIDKNKAFISSLRDRVRHNYSEINNVQKDIFDIIKHLKHNNNVKNTYGEAVTRKLSSEDCLYRVQYIFNEMTSRGYVSQEEINDRSNEFFFVPGANFLIGAAGHINLLPAETKEGNEGAFEHRDDQFYIFDNRENIALSLLARSSEPYKVMIYGGKHDFQDNVEAWNTMHPDNMFSLIVVTPSSYKD